MIKHNLEHGGKEDILDVIRRNQEVIEDEDEIGLYDHIYDSNKSIPKKKKKKRKNREKVQTGKTPKSRKSYGVIKHSKYNF